MDEMRSLADLLDLQVVDLDIDRLLHDRQTLPVLDDYKRAHEALKKRSAELTEADGSLKQTTMALNKTSGELELADIKLGNEQNRLYAGGISARDADFLRQEVEMLQRKKTEMEDEILDLMERREVEEKTAEALRSQEAEAGETKTKLEQTIKVEWAEIDAALARKERRKGDIVPLIPEDLMELYDELRDVKEGVAAARLAEGICGGCHLRLTPAELLQVARSDPPRCTHCRRILVS